MFSPEVEDRAFEPNLRLMKRKGSKRKWSYKTSDEDESPVLTPNMSRASAVNTSHPALNSEVDVIAHSTPEVPCSPDLNKSRGRKRSILQRTQFVQEHNLSINDDAEERRNALENQLSGQANLFDSIDKSAGGSKSLLTLEIAAQCLDIKLSTEQLAAHLASCIELNAANKINKNNAFNLQLIDYMVVLLKRNDRTMKDFPTMSCSLDASTRIYACRVDNVHAGVMEIVTGLAGAMERHRKKLSKKDGSGDHSDLDDNETDDRIRKRKRKAVVASSLEAICRNSIDVANWMKRRAIQPDFTCLLNHATITQSPESGLSLLKDSIPLIPLPRQKAAHESKRVEVDLPDTPSNTSLFNSSFTFAWDTNEDVLQDSNVLIASEISFGVHDNTVMEECDQQQPSGIDLNVTTDVGTTDIEVAVSNVQPDDDTDTENVFPDDAPYNNDSSEEDTKENVEPVKEAENSREEVENRNGMCNKKRSGLDTLSLVSSRAIQAADHSVYSYVDSDLLPNLWVGPEHWKPRFKRGKPHHVVAEHAEKKPSRGKKAADHITYDDFTGSDSMYSKKLNLKLQSRLMDKWSEKKITLPYRKDFKIESQYGSFLRKTLFYKPYLKQEKETEIKTEIEFADSCDHLFDDAKLENKDLLEFNDYTSEFGDGGSVQDNQSDCEYPEPASPGDGDFSPVCNTSNLFQAENLVPLPHMVECGTINYATVPKRLDMKKLKNTVWNMMDLEGDKENKNRNNKVNGIIEKDGEIHFSSIYKQLPRELPSDMWNDMSPAIVFLSVLHLANEKTLRIISTDKETISDVLIDKDEQNGG